MKKFGFHMKHIVVAAACFAVSIMFFTGCDKDDDPQTGVGIADTEKFYVSATANGEKVYTLKVTQTLVKSTAVQGDTYVLLYVDKSGEVKTSAGAVTSSDGNALVLTPASGAAFTVTVTKDGITAISGNITFTDNSTAAGGTLTPLSTGGEIEITGAAITDDRVLGVPGMAINYVYNGEGLFAVRNSATLVVLPGTTIRFSKTSGGIIVEGNATVKMLGTDKLFALDAEGKLSATPSAASGHVTLKGGAAKGSWDGMVFQTNKENQLIYVDLLNGGSRTDFQNCPAVITLDNGGKLAMSFSKISGSKCNGLSAGFQGATIAAFDHNVIENCDLAPVYLYQNEFKLAAAFDATSEMSNNTLAYVSLPNISLAQGSNTTINKTSVPYYVRDYGGELQSKLTINEGVTFYMAESASLAADYGEGAGQLIINGTAANPVLFTRLPGTTYYWQYITFQYNSSHSIKYCNFEYGGGEEGMGMLDFGRESTVSLQNVNIRNSNNYGVTLFAISSVTHNNIVFENCKSGNVGLYYAHIGIVETVLGQLP